MCRVEPIASGTRISSSGGRRVKTRANLTICPLAALPIPAAPDCGARGWRCLRLREPGIRDTSL